jgi:endonuclease/exonuclease/phosphatase family metal-dependent hydrolase
MRGLTTESDREEIKMQMGREGLHLVCGQETWVAEDQSKERWDSGELFLNCGGMAKRKHEGVCFFVSSETAKMFERGGRRLVKCGPRLATIRLQLRGGAEVCVINARAPDSGQSEEKRNAFQRQLERAMQAGKAKGVVLMMGDFNAAMGVAADEQDEVMGKYGPLHTNDAGRASKMFAAARGMVDLASMREQKFYGTWVHPRSKKWHQLDRIFMRKCQSYMVNRCYNAEILKPSDHFSVRINLTISTPPKIPNTVRQKMNGEGSKVVLCEVSR